MARTVEKKTVFISGASDTLKEMKIVEDVVRSLSKVFCPRLNLMLEPVMGETNALAGVGRPQGRINPLVEECDLFIGVYKKDFGTNTGKCSSGIEEEFKIAFKRHKKTKGKVEIILFFVKISEHEIVKMGPRLQNMLNFKKDVRARLLYKSFSTKNDLAFKCYEQIIQWIWKEHDHTKKLNTQEDKQ